jgi:hypothetical protein
LRQKQTCHNCGATLTGPFCATCGQHVHALNPTLRDVVHDVTHEVLHLDGRMFRTLRKLLLSPGFLTLDYFKGRRARWIPPLRLYLTFSVLYFALAALSGSNMGATIHDTDETVMDRPAGFNSTEEVAETIREAMGHWVPRAMFVLVPLFALLVGVAFRKTGSHYPHHLYFSLHVHAAWFAAALVVTGVYAIAGDRIGRVISLVAMLYGWWYFVRALRVVYRLSLSRTVFRAVGIGFSYVIVVIAAITAIVLPALYWHKP